MVMKLALWISETNYYLCNKTALECVILVIFFVTDKWLLLNDMENRHAKSMDSLSQTFQFFSVFATKGRFLENFKSYRMLKSLDQ